MSILNKYNESEKQAIIVDFDRPGFAFVIDILNEEEIKCREKLRLGGINPQDDLILLASWRASVRNLDLIKTLPQKLSHILASSVSELDINNPALIRPAPIPPGYAYSNMVE